MCYYTTRERELTYEVVIIGITLQFFSEKSVQYLLCSRPWESPMICQKNNCRWYNKFVIQFPKCSGLYAIWKADLFIFVFSLYSPTHSLSLSLFLQVYFSPVFSSCANFVFVYLFKGRFQKSSVFRFAEGFNFSLVLHLPWYFCECSCSPYLSI